MVCGCAQALRFGNDKEACLKAIDIGFEGSPKPSSAGYKAAINTFELVSVVSAAWALYDAVIGNPGICAQTHVDRYNILCTHRMHRILMQNSQLCAFSSNCKVNRWK